MHSRQRARTRKSSVFIRRRENYCSTASSGSGFRPVTGRSSRQASVRLEGQRQNGIASVQKNAASATVQDLTEVSTPVSRPKQVSKVAFPNGKIYVGDLTGSLLYFRSPANLDQITSEVRAARLGAGPSRRRFPVHHHALGGRRVLRACRTDTGMRFRRWPRR